MRTRPECNQTEPEPKHPEKRRSNAAPVWTCRKCRNKLRKRAQRATGFRPNAHYKQRTLGAITGPAERRTTPETAAKIRALFETEPEKTIHRLCDLLEGLTG